MARVSIATPRCLIVEDEVLIGLDLDDSLCAAGFEVRCVASIRSAFEVLATAAFDVAILDFIVRSEPCMHLARELKQRHIPFLIYSGQPRDESSGEFRGVPWLEKPADPKVLITALVEVIDRPEARCRDVAAVVPTRVR